LETDYPARTKRRFFDRFFNVVVPQLVRL